MGVEVGDHRFSRHGQSGLRQLLVVLLDHGFMQRDLPPTFLVPEDQGEYTLGLDHFHLRQRGYVV